MYEIEIRLLRSFVSDCMLERAFFSYEIGRKLFEISLKCLTFISLPHQVFDQKFSFICSAYWISTLSFVQL